MNFSEAMFYENYLTSDFHINTVSSKRVCLLVKMAFKTVIGPIVIENSQEILLDHADFALQEQPEDNLIVALSRHGMGPHIPWMLNQSNPLDSNYC